MGEISHYQELIQMLQDLAGQVKVLNERVSQQEEELTELRAKLAISSGYSEPISTQPTPVTTTRRTMLRRLAVGFMLGAIASSTGVLAGQPQQAQARVIINPSSVSNKIGALIFPSTTTYANQPQQSSTTFGIITSADPGTLDLTTLPFFDTGIYTAGAGNGLYATCSNSQGNAVYALNTATTGTGNAFGVYGVSTMGAGVAGANTGTGIGVGVFGQSNTGPGVYGYSGGGVGVKAESGSGAPLTIKSGNTPTSGTRAFGDLYVDSTGKIYAWAKNDAGTISNWRQLAFAT